MVGVIGNRVVGVIGNRVIGVPWTRVSHMSQASKVPCIFTYKMW